MKIWYGLGPKGVQSTLLIALSYSVDRMDDQIPLFFPPPFEITTIMCHPSILKSSPKLCFEARIVKNMQRQLSPPD